MRNWAELIAFARDNPGRLRWAAATLLSGLHLCNAAAFQHAGIERIFVPFNGGAEAVTALLGGHIDLAVSLDYAPLVADNCVRLLSEIGADRASGMENIPCFGELGYPLTTRIGFGLVGPAGLPPEVTEIWVRVLRRIDAMPEWQELMRRFMAVRSLVAGDAFREQMLSSYRTLARILASLRIDRS